MTGAGRNHHVWERREDARARNLPGRKEPAWRTEARRMHAEGMMPKAIGDKLGLHRNTIGRFIESDRGDGAYIAFGGDLREDAPFIQKHVTRVIRQVFDRDAVRRFIASGGGAKAREALMRRIAA